MATPPTRRKIGVIRRVQSERKGLNFWNKHDFRLHEDTLLPVQQLQQQQPRMVGISQGIMQSPCLPPFRGYYPGGFQPMMVLGAPIQLTTQVASPKEDFFLAQERLAAFLRSNVEPSPSSPSSLMSYSDSHVYESLVSQLSDLTDSEIGVKNEPKFVCRTDDRDVEQKSPHAAPPQRCATCKKLKLPANGLATPTKPAGAARRIPKPFSPPSIKKSTSTESIFVVKADHRNKPYVTACQKILSLFRRRKPAQDQIYQEIQSITSATSFTDFKTTVAASCGSSSSSNDGSNDANSSSLSGATSATVTGTPSNGDNASDKKLRMQHKSTQVSDSELWKPSFSTLDPLRPADRSNRSCLKHRSRSLVNLTAEKDALSTTEAGKVRDSKNETFPNFATSISSRHRSKNISWDSVCSEDDSVYSSAGDWCHWIDNTCDSLVLVYKSRSNGNKFTVNESLDSRGLDTTNFIKSRLDGSSGLGSSGSDFSSEDGPTLQTDKTNQSTSVPAGAKGTLTFDYSWSWNNLNNVVRNASLSGYEQTVHLEHYPPQVFV